MAESDRQRYRILRAYRRALQIITRRAEREILFAWRQPDFGIADEDWVRWAAEHPEVPGYLRRMPRDSTAWEQLRLDIQESQLSLWSAQALRIAESAQYQTAVATQAFLARYSDAMRERKGLPVPIAPTDVTTLALRGVDGLTVWERPPSQMRIALNQGLPPAAARKKGEQLARVIINTDSQLAHVRSAVQYYKERADRDNIVGYRRIPRGGRSCALCLLASTQRYHRGDLMPVHDHCHCITEPIYGDRDPGQVILPAQLKAVHARIEQATGSADLSGGHYRDAVIVHHHGEIGPVLTYREHSFTGPSDLNDN